METRKDTPPTTIKVTAPPLPSWYDDHHRSTWERVKDALRRDWEQTRNDFGAETSRDLQQGIGDTLKQATGSEPLPPLEQKPRLDMESLTWTDVEPAVRYGYAARARYANHTLWDDTLERRLRREWISLDTGYSWDHVRTAVRRGWDSRKQPS